MDPQLVEVGENDYGYLYSDIRTGETFCITNPSEPEVVENFKTDLTFIYQPSAPVSYIFLPHPEHIRIVMRVAGDLDLPSGYWDVEDGYVLIRHNYAYVFRPTFAVPGYFLPHSPHLSQYYRQINRPNELQHCPNAEIIVIKGDTDATSNMNLVELLELTAFGMVTLLY